MASITTLRYEGSIAALRGCIVTSIRECGCAKCLVTLDDLHVDVTVDNFGPVRMSHARRSSFVEVAAVKGSIEERCGELLKAFGLAA
jgi:hypothetical protein